MVAPSLSARIIANPNAGRGDQGTALREAAGVFAAAGWTIGWRTTDRQGHAAEITADAVADGIDIVVAAGGDGTVNEIANGLVGTATALAVLPAGTGNVLAAQLGLIGVPTPIHRGDLPEAAAHLTRGVVRPIDTGFARPRGQAGRHFVLWAGVGLDAAVTRDIEGEHTALKRRFGPAALGALGIKLAIESEGVPAVVRCDERRSRVPLLLAVVSNVRLYAGTVELAPNARLDDGLLDVALVAGTGVMSKLQHIGTAVRRGVGGISDVRPARRTRIVARQPLPVHLDAEPFGTTPMTFEVRPLSLQLLVPPTAPADLFGPADEGNR